MSQETPVIRRLSETQRDALAAWWRFDRTRTRGYFRGELCVSRKATAQALYRAGLIERPGHDDIYGWHAPLTDEGKALAERLYAAQREAPASGEVSS